jgi:cytochrome c
MSRATLILISAGLITAAACKTTNGASTTASENTLSSKEQKAGWKLLFDGKTTAGWRNYKKESVGSGWTVVNGILTRSGDDAGDIITVDKYRNFELALEWRISEGGNSGILYRATEDNDFIWQSAPEMQILDNERHNDGKLELTSAGSDFAVYPAPHSATHPAGQWNSVRLIVNGNHVEHWMNGQKVVEYDFGSPDWAARVAASKFKTMPNYGKATEGYIGLQDHGDKVEFRNIRIRVLP